MPRRSQDLPEEYTEYERALAKAIGTRVRQRRLQLNLTQEEVRARMELEQVHVSRTQFSRIELGESLLNAAEIVALVAALNSSFGWLLTGQKEQS